MAETHTYTNDDSGLPLGIRAARWFVLAAILGCVLVASGLWVHHVLRSGTREQSAVRWMTVLDLSMPALWPSGTALRFPESVSTGVDLRFSPGAMDLEGYAATSGVLLKHALRKDVP